MTHGAQRHDRVDHEAREHLLRIASVVASRTGVELTAGRLRKLVTHYRRSSQTGPWGFFDYIANALQLDALTKQRARRDPTVQRVIEYADPTGEQAVSNVMRERRHA